METRTEQFQNTLIKEDKLSWKEKFAAIVILAIGIIMLALEVASILSYQGSQAQYTGDTLTINFKEFISHSRYIVLAIIALGSCFLLFKKRRLGWIIGVPLLAVSVMIAGYFCYVNYVIYPVASVEYIILVAVLFAPFLLSLIFLFTPSARRKYKVGKQSLLPTLVFLMALCAMFFFLQ